MTLVGHSVAVVPAAQQRDAVKANRACTTRATASGPRSGSRGGERCTISGRMRRGDGDVYGLFAPGRSGGPDGGVPLRRHRERDLSGVGDERGEPPRSFVDVSDRRGFRGGPRRRRACARCFDRRPPSSGTAAAGSTWRERPDALALPRANAIAAPAVSRSAASTRGCRENRSESVALATVGRRRRNGCLLTSSSHPGQAPARCRALLSHDQSATALWTGFPDSLTRKQHCRLRPSRVQLAWESSRLHAGRQGTARRPRQSSRQRGPGRLLAHDSGSAGHVRELSFSDVAGKVSGRRRGIASAAPPCRCLPRRG
jgi:hypothetical protein